MGTASELGLKLLSAALSHHSGGAAPVRDVGLLLPQDSLRLLVLSRANGWVLELPVMGMVMVELGAGIMEVVTVEVVAAA
jgi:hypothetical protein